MAISKNTSVELTPVEVPAIADAKKEKDYKYMRDRDREMVRGMFKFYEVPGGLLEFSYLAYKGDEVETYRLVDGVIYTIPRGVARHLNSSGSYPEYEYNKSERGVVTGMGDGKHEQWVKVSKKVRRYGFNSLEFFDDEDLKDNRSDLVSVERM